MGCGNWQMALFIMLRYGRAEGQHTGLIPWWDEVELGRGELLHTAKSDINSTVAVWQHGEFRALWLEDVLQSVVWVPPGNSSSYGAGAAPATCTGCSDTLVFGYPQVMAAAAAAFSACAAAGARSAPGTCPLLQPGACVACLGVGAGALPLFLHRRLPRLVVDAVEVDPAVALAAQRCFGFPPLQADSPPALTLLVEDAAAYRLLPRLTALFLDCFDGRGEVPLQLQQPRFLRDCAAALAPGGVLVTNLLNGKAGSLQRARIGAFAAAVAGAFASEVYTIRVPGQAPNVIVVAVKPTVAVAGACLTGEATASAAQTLLAVRSASNKRSAANPLFLGFGRRNWRRPQQAIG
ncbi:hypothetical protein WJX81_003306 [Elliptochloris bilobata]|uniref:Uncharacterized protein n=1 Tax=Elliptochloris bilobata TaxID=381761 RepID=A0AAW1RTQ1_9CHLO